jgi:hypothetical protein
MTLFLGRKRVKERIRREWWREYECWKVHAIYERG